jgi:hypothetical protein
MKPTADTSHRAPQGDDRIPNRPWLFANGTAGALIQDLITQRDRLSFDWTTRYVHPFFRGWESIGAPQFKQRVPAQVLHSIAVAYGAAVRTGSVTGSVEVLNLLDAPAFDFFAVQRPGRSVFGKIVINL